MNILRQSTAVDVLIGPFVDSTDGDTEETALTIAQADVRLSKNGQTAAQKSDVTSAAHDADGFYNCELDATDTDTVGAMVLYVHVAGALAVRHEFQIVEEAVYDALFAASAPGYVANAPVNVAQLSGDATAADNAEAFFDGTGYAGTNNVIPTVTTLTNAPSDSSGITTLLSRLSAARAGYLDNLSAGAVALEASLQSLITTVGAAGAGLTATASAVWSVATRVLTAGTNIVLAKGVGVTGFNDLSAAQVNAEAGQALVDVHLDHLFAVAYDPASKPGAADALLNEIVQSDAGVAQFTANALELAPTGGSAPTVDQIADGVWDEARAGHVAAGSFGEGAASVQGNVTGSAASVTGAVGSVTGNVGGNVVGSVASVTAGVTLAASAIQAIWDALTSALTTVGSIGKLLVDNLNATISSRATQTSVDDLPTNAELAAALTNLDAAVSTRATPAQVAAELTTYDGPTNAEMVARTLPSAQYATAAAIVTIDTVVDGIAVQTTRVDGLIEDVGGDRFTAKALEETPCGGAGGWVG